MLTITAIRSANSAVWAALPLSCASTLSLRMQGVRGSTEQVQQVGWEQFQKHLHHSECAEKPYQPATQLAKCAARAGTRR